MIKQLKRWQLIFLYASIFFAWMLSSYALFDFGIYYSVEGGTPFLKIHIYSYIIFVLAISVLLRYGVNGFLKPLGEFRKYWISLFLAVSWLILYGLYRQGMSGMAYVVDTLLTPLLCMPLVFRLSKRQCVKMLGFISLLMLINAFIALLEFYLTRRIWSVEFPEFGAYFRSTALMGHPLNNALIMCSLAIILARYSRFGVPLYLMITGMSLFAFGARGATAIFLIGIIVLIIYSLLNMRIKRSRNSQLLLALIPVTVMMLGLFSYYFLFHTNLAERIFSGLYIDASASTRLDVFALLSVMNPGDLIFGANENLVQNFDGIINNAVIENYILGWLFNFGLLGVGYLIISFFRLMWKFFMVGDFYVKLVVLMFSFVSITNNSLSTKTSALLFLLLVLSLFVRLHEVEKLSGNWKLG